MPDWVAIWKASGSPTTRATRKKTASRCSRRNRSLKKRHDKECSQLRDARRYSVTFPISPTLKFTFIVNNSTGAS